MDYIWLALKQKKIPSPSYSKKFKKDIDFSSTNTSKPRKISKNKNKESKKGYRRKKAILTIEITRIVKREKSTNQSINQNNLIKVDMIDKKSNQ
jgi:hypothetical protein